MQSNSAVESIRMIVPHLRRMLEWTQFDLSRASGIERSRISLFECGHVDLTKEQVDRLGAALIEGLRQREAVESWKGFEESSGAVQ